jgi:cell division control protein 6
MITDAAVFTEDYCPQNLLHRDTEQDQLARAFEPAFTGDRASDALIHGPQGVGKTLLTNHLLDRLDARAGIQYATVRSLGKSAAGIFRATLQELGVDIAQNTPRHDLAVHLRERVDEPTVVVLDEADDVPATDALAHLWDVPLLSVVVICHDRERWLSRLDVDEQRCWHDAVDLHLNRYSPGELADILEPRAEKGLRSGAVDREVLEEIADEAAGSARRAIVMLQSAAEVAVEREHERIRDGDVPAGLERGQHRMRKAHLASLSMHHHVLYELIRRAGEIDGEVLHDRYEDVADSVYAGETQVPVGKRMRRYHLDKLEEYDLIEQDDEDDGRYRVLDADVSSSLNVDIPTPNRGCD